MLQLAGEMEIGMAGRTAADSVRLLERAMRTKQLMEERRVQALKDELLNEWGESLDALQATWRPSATSMQTYSQNVSAYARAMREREAEESRQRESFGVAKRADSRIQRLVLSESLRETAVYVEHRANKIGKAAASLPFGANFTYQDFFHTDAVPGGVAPCLDACQGAPVRCSTFSRTGAVLATGDNSCTVRLWAKPKTAAQLVAEKAEKEARRAAEEAELEAARRREEGFDTTLTIVGDELEKDGATAWDASIGGADVSGQSEDPECAESLQDVLSARAANSGSAAVDERTGGMVLHEPSVLVTTTASAVSEKGADVLTAEEQRRSAVMDAQGGHAPAAPVDAPTPQAAPAGAGAASAADQAAANLKARIMHDEGREPDSSSKPWRSSQQLKGHKSPVTALVFVAQGELGPKPVLFTAAGDWKVVHWEPDDDDGKWRMVSELPVSHAAWIMDLCYVSRTVCALCEVRGPLLVTAAGDKSLKVLVHHSADTARRETTLGSPSPLGALDAHAQERQQHDLEAAVGAAEGASLSLRSTANQHTPGQSGAASPMPTSLSSPAQGSPAGAVWRADGSKKASLLSSAAAGEVRGPLCRKRASV